MGLSSQVKSIAVGTALFMMIVWLAACTTAPAREEAIALFNQGRFEEGIAKLEQVVKENPENGRYRIDLVNARTNYLNRLIAAAGNERALGRIDAARVLYEKANAIDPTSERTRQGLEELRRDQRHAEIIRTARAAFDKGNLSGAITQLQPVLAENPANVRALELKGLIEDKRVRDLMASPQLELAFRKPVNLEFRDASLRTVFDALSRSTGINYI